jgi:hypothetical protein
MLIVISMNKLKMNLLIIFVLRKSNLKNRLYIFESYDKSMIAIVPQPPPPPPPPKAFEKI